MMNLKRLLVFFGISLLGFAQSSKYATQVLAGTLHVDKPALALGAPDGSYAGIELYGNLDLEISVTNGEGDDLAVYAKRPAYGILPETMNYAVLVLSAGGDWKSIGIGSGEDEPERFDLGDIQSAEKVRILFKDPTDIVVAKPNRTYPQEYKMGIDAVEALN